MSELPIRRDFAVDFLLGGISAAFSKTAVAPVERIKLLLQTEGANNKLTKNYAGVWDVLRRVTAEEGVFAFWRGNLANVIRYFPTQALNFALNDKYKKYLNPFDPKTEFFRFFVGNVVSGSAAGASSLLVVYPLDFARTRLAADIGKDKKQRQFTGLVDCISKIYKSDGAKGLYRGFGASILTVVIYRGAYFGGYDTFKKTILTADSSIVYKFFLAQSVTILAGLLAYPFDTIRRNLMMQSGREGVMYKGTIDCTRTILRMQGLKGLFKGGFANIIRGIGASLVLVEYDEIRPYILRMVTAR